MNKEQLLHQVDKIFRANTVKSDIDNGPFATNQKDVIEDIGVLKEEIKELIRKQFHAGEVEKLEIFNGSGKIGASYHISEAIAVAKEWGYKYLSFNEQIWTVEGRETGFNINEI